MREPICETKLAKVPLCVITPSYSVTSALFIILNVRRDERQRRGGRCFRGFLSEPQRPPGLSMDYLVTKAARM